jgi:hypothetical protein
MILRRGSKKPVSSLICNLGQRGISREAEQILILRLTANLDFFMGNDRDSFYGLQNSKAEKAREGFLNDGRDLAISYRSAVVI